MKISRLIFVLVFFVFTNYNSNRIHKIGNDYSLKQAAIDELMEYDIITIGEVHGTNETSIFIGNLVKVKSICLIK